MDAPTAGHTAQADASADRPDGVSRRTRQLTAVISLVVVGGALATALIALTGSGTQGPVATPPLGGWLPLLLLGVTVVGDLIEVRLRHGGEAEGLTLFEAAVVADALLLSPRIAVLIPPLAVAIAAVIGRRPAIKTIFNIGSFAMSGAALIGMVTLFSAQGEGITAQAVLGLVLGALCFAIVNVLCLAQVLWATADVPVRQTLFESWQLSAIMGVGAVGVGGIAVAVLMSSPALLPFALLPALAMTMTFRAQVQEAEERERSGKLLDLSQVLASRRVTDDLLSSFLDLLRETFGAGTALIVLEGDEENSGVVVEAGGAGVRRRPLTALDAALLARVGVGTELVRTGLPDRWGRMLLAPLDAEGIRLGVLALVEPPTRRPQLKERDLAVFTPLVSALGAALRAAGHLERLVAETSKLKAVVDFSSDGIYVLDPEGRVVVWNPAIAHVTGVGADAAVGRPLTEVMSTLGAEGGPVDPLREALDELTPDEPRATVEMGVQRADGEQRWLRASHAAVFDGDDLVRDVVIAHDVTRERQVERMKADFIATVSHELRTPITPIKGYVDLLRRKGDAFTPDKRRECLDIVADRVAHLGRLVEDLLLASRVSSPASAVRMGSGDLVHLTAKAVGDFAAQKQRISTYLPPGEVTAACDPVRVVQVVSNLVSNALKYSAADSPVTVRLAVDEGQAHVSVADEGRGIPADQLERVFDKFHRVEDPMRMTTAGTGLGLFIARQLTAAMGGTLSVSSTLGVGSTFTFSLPLQAKGQPIEAPASIPWPRGAQAPRSASADAPTAGAPPAPGAGEPS